MTLGQFAISSCTTDLLNIILNRPRQIKVDNRLDVGLINSHAKCDCAAKYAYLVQCELLLSVSTLLVRLTSMVCLCFDTVRWQKLSYLFSCPSLRRKKKDWVDRLVRFWTEQSHEWPCFVFISSDWKLKIDAGKVCLRHKMFRVLNFKNVANLLLTCFCGCCSETKHSRVLSKFLFYHLVQHQVRWSEIVGPLTCTVNLIHTNHWDSSAKLRQILHKQPFCSDIQDFYLFFLYCLDYILLQLIALLTVDGCAGEEVWKFVELICHKCYERRYH